MKYCPYCGVDLPDSTVSFCAECGNALPSERKNDIQSERKKHKPVQNKAHTKKRKRETSKIVPEVLAEKTPVVEEGYDGYYDDVLPMDTGRCRERIDQSMIQKIAILISALVVIIGICVVLMYLL